MTEGSGTTLAYQRLISLGISCQTAAQIRRYTGIDTPGLFDWVLSGWEGLTKCIENDFSEFFKLPNLKLVRDDIVRDTATGFEFGHLFGVPGKRKIEPGMIERDYHRHEPTLRFLLRNFTQSLDDERVLLIRQGNPKPDTVLNLWNALQRAHPSGRFDLLIVNTTNRVTTIDHPHIRVGVVQMPPEGPEAWLGDNASWDSLLEEYAPLNRRKAPKKFAAPAGG